MRSRHVGFVFRPTDKHLELLLALYTDRTHELWKEPEVRLEHRRQEEKKKPNETIGLGTIRYSVGLRQTHTTY